MGIARSKHEYLQGEATECDLIPSKMEGKKSFLFSADSCQYDPVAF